MLHFDPNDPYPLLPAGSYAEAQEHASEADRFLGLRIAETESALNRVENQQLWIGLPVQAMLTPYTELREILAHLAPQPGQTVVDLGAGYGRLGLVIARHCPEVRFVGYEYVRERVEEGCRALKRQGAGAAIELVQADLSASDFKPISADFYFIYDYGTRDAIDKTLEDLRRVASGRPITVVGRGRASRDAIERGQPWLSQVREPEHRGRYSVYKS